MPRSSKSVRYSKKEPRKVRRSAAKRTQRIKYPKKRRTQRRKSPKTQQDDYVGEQKIAKFMRKFLSSTVGGKRRKRKGSKRKGRKRKGSKRKR